MKINKIIIRITHFFGCMKKQEHIDDVEVQVCLENWDEDRYEHIIFGSYKETEDEIDEIKTIIFNEFKNNSKLEQRCNNVNQVWVLFRRTKIPESDGILKRLMYKYGKLYYPTSEEDVKSFNRLMKLERIINK